MPVADPPASRPWLQPRWHFRLLRATVVKAHSDSLGLQSAALAFTTILALVPLLSVVFASRAFAAREEQLIDLLSRLLPWSEELIVTHMRDFLAQAATLRGLGFAVFLLTCMAMFSTIEKTLNQVWNVDRRRPLKNRMLSFSLVLFWGPLLIGATYAILFRLEANPISRFLVETLPFQLLPALVTILGLTMLYWMVPYTAVDFRAALAGGVFSGLLFSLLRAGFGAYVERVPTLSVVYGSFGLALLFMISLQIAWWIALLGSVVAWCVQHVEVVDRPIRPAAPLDGAWVALAAMVHLTRRLGQGHPITPLERVAERLALRAPNLERILEPLIDAGVLARTGGDSEGILLARDPHEIPVADVLRVFDPLHDELFSGLEPAAAERIAALRRELVTERGGQSLHELARETAAPAKRRRKRKAASSASAERGKPRPARAG